MRITKTTMRLFLLLALLLISICLLLGYTSLQGGNTVNAKTIKDDWSKIKSFEALVTYTIGNKTYTSRVLFAKPNKALKEDINYKNITDVILIINKTEIIISDGNKFVLNATKSDIDALDPFIAILNNINSFRFEYKHNTLVLVPKNPELPKYIIKLGKNNLPKRITITQQNQTIITVNYIKIRFNINLEINKSVVNSIESLQLKFLKKLTIPVNGTTVFFFYSPFCPHCEEVMPFMKNLTKEYSEVKFVFCNVNNCNKTCKEVMEKYKVMFVPTVIVFKKNSTTIIVGSRDIKNRLEVILNEN